MRWIRPVFSRMMVWGSGAIMAGMALSLLLPDDGRLQDQGLLAGAGCVTPGEVDQANQTILATYHGSDGTLIRDLPGESQRLVAATYVVAAIKQSGRPICAGVAEHLPPHFADLGIRRP